MSNVKTAVDYVGVYDTLYLLSNQEELFEDINACFDDWEENALDNFLIFGEELGFWSDVENSDYEVFKNVEITLDKNKVTKENLLDFEYYETEDEAFNKVYVIQL